MRRLSDGSTGAWRNNCRCVSQSGQTRSNVHARKSCAGRQLRLPVPSQSDNRRCRPEVRPQRIAICTQIPMAPTKLKTSQRFISDGLCDRVPIILLRKCNCSGIANASADSRFCAIQKARISDGGIDKRRQEPGDCDNPADIKQQKRPFPAKMNPRVMQQIQGSNRPGRCAVPSGRCKNRIIGRPVGHELREILQPRPVRRPQEALWRSYGSYSRRHASPPNSAAVPNRSIT